MKSKIVSETPMNTLLVKRAIDATLAKDKTLNFRAQKTLDHLQAVVRVDVKKAEDLFDELIKLEISRVKEGVVHKLIDVAPTTPDQVKTVLQAYNLTLTKENMQKIADVIAKYVK